MVQVVRLHEAGGPDKLVVEDLELGPPGPGDIQIAQTAIGLNFIDTYQRSGLYPLELPAVLGMEGAGVIEALGEDVSDLKVGDRVAYPMQPGAYAAARNLPADRVFKIPVGIDDQTAAAMALKGMTAEYLLERCFQVRRGQTILFHAAAGGVGLIACQWAKTLGATVIGTVLDRGQGRAGARPMAAITRSSRRPKISRRGSRRSPRVRACPWSTTPSAATPSTPPWTRWRHVACSSASASRPGP